MLESVRAFAPTPGCLGEALEGELDVGGVSTVVGVLAADYHEPAGISDERIAPATEDSLRRLNGKSVFLIELGLRKFLEHSAAAVRG